MPVDKPKRHYTAYIIILSVVMLFTSYVTAYFVLGQHSVTADRYGARMRVRIFNDPRWLCKLFQPMEQIESSFIEDTTLCYRLPPDEQ
jgi:hypothetical protein